MPPKVTTSRTDRWEQYCGLSEEPKSPLRAIRLFCLECCGSHSGFIDASGNRVPPKRELKAVEDCPATHCKLWPYRFGRNTYHKKSRTPREKGKAGGKNGVFYGSKTRRNAAEG